MIEIDGNEGGGQILRSSLALAALTDQPVRVENIRGNRPESGLKPQHLAAVRALERITGASVDGALLGSETVIFEPGTVGGGSIDVEIPTAGSLTLLFDAVLPLATRLGTGLSVTATGGTEVAWSPPLAAHEHAKLPLCRRFGLLATIERHRTGFYSAGGGQATLWLCPSTLDPFDLTDRGELERVRIVSRSSTDLTENDVALRQATQAASHLSETGIDVDERTIGIAETDSTGSAITVVFEYEHSRATFDALGEPGKPAEAVTDDAITDALDFHDSSAVVDRHLADQLVLFLALAGGEMHIPTVTEHVETHCELLDQFGFEVQIATGETPTVSAPGGLDR